MSGKAPQANTQSKREEKNKRGEANGSAAPWRGCPLGLVYLNLREFCFCRKLEDARVG